MNRYGVSTMNKLNRLAAILLAAVMLLAMCSCKDKDNGNNDQQEQILGTGSSSNFEIEAGVKLKIRTSSDYYIDGEDIVMTAVITNETSGYIPVCSPVGAYGREGALTMAVTADGYNLVCAANEWGKTMPVSMSDVEAPYYFLLEPGQSITCNYVYKPMAEVGKNEQPLWQTTVLAKMTVQLADELEKRQGGLEKLTYSPHSVTVEITFDGTADKPAA